MAMRIILENGSLTISLPCGITFRGPRHDLRTLADEIHRHLDMMEAMDPTVDTEWWGVKVPE